MKISRLSYDEWKCIISKELSGTFINTDFFIGYLGLLNIKAVSEAQIWNYNGQKLTVCDKGINWLSILPQNDHYCITAMMNEKNELLLWYIDMIMGQGIDIDGIPYFEDLYLDLIVYPDGTIVTDDMDELEKAWAKNDISLEQFNLAIDTCNKLKNGLLSDIDIFKEYTQKCLNLTANAVFSG